MYKIMIVDDEAKIRKGLSQFIDWVSLDCTVIHVASNGEEAIEQVNTELPDIVLTDIKMPVLNGIELSRHLYEHHPDIKVIILTGFADFEYSKQAIQYNVVDFVLKPTTQKKIFSAVKKTIDELDSSKQIADKIDTLENQLAKHSEDLMDLIISKSIQQVPVDPDAYRQALDTSIIWDSYVCVVVRTEDSVKSDNMSDSYLCNLKNFILEIFNPMPLYIHVRNVDNICIFISQSKDSKSQDLENLITLSTELIETTKSILELDIKLGISHCHTSLDEIYPSHTEATEAIRRISGYSTDSINVYQDKDELSKDYNGLESSLQEKIKAAISATGSPDFKALVTDAFDLMKDQFMDIETIRAYALMIHSGFYNLSDIQGDLKEDIPDILDSIIQLQLTPNAETAKLTLLDLYEAVPENRSNQFDNALVNEVNEYISLNYQDNISLSIIASALSINSSYLSRLYKKVTGLNLTTFITKYRINKAIELLKSSEMKIYQVAESVGIEDPTYFSQLFKKYTGHNPTYYRK